MTNETQVMELVPVGDGGSGVTMKQVPVITAQAGTPLALMQYAMQTNSATLDQLERLMAMQRELEANDARKAYVEDMAKFKLNPPTIYKDKQVSFEAGRGKTEYRHATIGNVTDKIISALAQHGFSHSWDTKQQGGQVIVTCKITHRLGHSESVTLESAPDNSGGKNGIQSIISAQSYLQRHSLLAATGLATHDQPDDDGASVGLTTDTRLADEWLAKVAVAPTEADLVALWKPGSQALAKDKLGFKEFEAAFIERRTVLAGAQ